jgi:polyhydroxyalkanoate synthesis regulator phasin
MQDALRTYLAMANGLTEVSRKRAKTAAKKLVKQSGETMEQVQALTDDLLSTSRANRDSLTTLVRYEVDRALGAVGLATVDEVESLTARIHELEAELRDARRSGGPSGDGAESSARGSRVAAAEARAEASAAKKAPAKKVAAKKAAAKKAGAKKAPANKAAPAEAPVEKAVAKKAPAAKKVAAKAAAKALPEVATTPPAAAKVLPANATAGGTPEPGTAAPSPAKSASAPAQSPATSAPVSSTDAGAPAEKTAAKKAPAKKAASPQAIATKPAVREVQEQVAEVKARKVAKLPATNPATATSESGGTEL